MRSMRSIAGMALLAVVGCSGGGGDATGSISLALTDGAVDNATSVVVEITGVRLKPQGGGVVERTFAAPQSFDLLTLTGENSAQLLNGEVVPAGPYNWIELLVNAQFDDILDSYAMLDDGSQVELQVPSTSAGHGVRAVSGFIVPQGGEISLIIDWDLRMALTDAIGQPGLFIRPALRITNLAEVGAIGGTVALDLVTDASCTNDLNTDTGNAVYVYSGFGVAPDDIDGNDPEPIATAPVRQNTDGDYAYLVAYLSPGAYTIAFTCQAADDDSTPGANDTIDFVQPTDAAVIADQTTTVPFQ